MMSDPALVVCLGVTTVLPGVDRDHTTGEAAINSEGERRGDGVKSVQLVCSFTLP